jgi:hypothetical protein
LRRLSSIAASFELDSAVALGIAVRLWQFIAGPVTIWLIGNRFSETQQGYFYTFGSLLAIQTFFELGLQTVLINLVSHEWARVADRNAAIPQRFTTAESARWAGDDSRLASMFKLLVIWYAACAVCFIAVTWVIGATALQKSESHVDWRLPWSVLVVLTGIQLTLSPLGSFLMGCNQVRTVHQFRLVQAVLGNAAVWTVILCGGGLWTAVAAAAVQVLMDFALVGIRFRRFFLSLFCSTATQAISWSREVWPLQWRIAVQAIAHWFANQTFTLAMWTFASESVAGRMGMTWTVFTAIQSLGIVWLQTRIPALGALIAQGNHDDAFRLARKVAVSSYCLVSAGTVSFLTVVETLRWLNVPIAERFLSSTSLAVFGVGLIVNHSVFCVGTYIRAYRIDPFLRVNAGGSLVTGTLVWSLSYLYGETGAAFGYMLVVVLILVPGHLLILRKFRLEHSANTASANAGVSDS